MPEVSIAQHYHQRTKYDPETIASKNRGLDWHRQPSPYKEYPVGKVVDLKPYLQNNQGDNSSDLNALGDLGRRLSRLLLLTYGLTAKIPTLSSVPQYLRAAPSAGGLYPAEIYLISRGTSLLPKGLYNYQVQRHTLIQFWDSDGWNKLQAATFAHPLLDTTDLSLVITAVFYRSAWRYEDRAYRRIFLDTGHLLGNLELAASLQGFRPYLIGGFADEQVNELLYLDPEQEGAIAIVPLLDQQSQSSLPPILSALPSPLDTHYPQLQEGELLAYLHEKTQIPATPLPQIPSSLDSVDKYNFPFCTKVATAIIPLQWEPESLESTILKRRSTRAYTGAELTLEELLRLLDFTYHPEHYSDQGLDAQPDYFDLDLVQTFIAVSGVIGLEEGCYYYAPHGEELRQIRFKNFRQELHYLCLGQDLARDAAVVVFHTVNLASAIAKWGDRAYRYLHMDAGHLGQRLNLAAIYLNLGVSGIGGFFDDQVNDILGIPPEEAVLYITTLGHPRSGLF
jgi:SagB-type dehydrogenase family enzyme